MQNGISPVHVASQEGHTEIVDLLIQAGADINMVTTDKVHGTHTHTLKLVPYVLAFTCFALNCRLLSLYSML